MKKTLFLFSLFLLTINVLGQAPTIDAGSDTIVCETCVDLVAEYTGGANTTDYTVETIPFAPDPFEGTIVSLSDDGVSGALPIGFDFCFYGDTYSNFYVSSNGWVGFSGGPGTWNPVAIPSGAATVPKNCVMGPWQDLNPNFGGTIRYQVLGVAPLRRLVVSWSAVPYFSCTGEIGTQQIVLFETTNVVENHIDEKYICAGWAGGRAVQGVHNAAGTEAVVVAGRNNTVWPADDESVRYNPLGDPEIEWFQAIFPIGTGPEITLCPDVSTEYIVKLSSCGSVVAEDTIFIDVVCCEAPDMTMTPASCFGGCDGTATADPIGFPPFTYAWSDGQTTATAIDLCAGDYSVEITDALGCIATGEITITEPDEIILDETSMVEVSCFGFADGEILVEASGGTGELTYDIGDGPVATGNFDGLTAGAYTVTVTDENGCTVTVDFDITEPDLLTLDIDLVTNVSCFDGDDGEITVAAGGGTPGYSYSLEGGGFEVDPTFSDLTAGSYDIDVQDANGCITSIIVDVTEPPVLNLDLVGTVDITCFGGSDGELEVIGGGGTGALEYSVDGVVFVAATTFTGLSAGTYDVVVRDANGCELILPVTLGEAPAVDIDELITNETCLGDCLGEITLDPVEGVAPFTFSIDGCATTDPDGVYSALCAGMYDVCVTDANGCIYENTVEVEDGETPADATITPFGPLCIDDDPVILSAVSPGGVYSGPGVVGGQFDPSVAGVGTHTITNTIDIGCGDVATFDVTVNALPVVSFTSDIVEGCAPLSVTFSNTGDPGASCAWNFGSGTSSSCGPVTHNYTVSGVYDVSYTVTDANGCSATATSINHVEVYEVPTANFRFTPQPTTTIMTEITFRDYSTAADSWTWTFGDLGTSNEEEPVFFFPEEAGSYDVTLVVENDFGCSDMMVQTVVISEQYLVYVPNAFTPDGDLFNDVFLPYFNGIDVYNYRLAIYNRWGEIIFESYDPSVGWDGTYGGEVVEQGVYIWHIQTDEITSDKKNDYYGHVTILK